MAIYELSAELRSPACFSSSPAMGNEVQTLRFVPGSAVRGMLASTYIQDLGIDNHFRDLFAPDGLRFGNLYPGGAFVIPFSAYTCKRYPGFIGDPSLLDGALPHGVVDRLYENMPGESSNLKRVCTLKNCGFSLVPLQGQFYAASLRRVDVPMETHMRTAISGQGSGRTGFLFTQEELAAHTTFRGRLVGLSTMVEALRDRFCVEEYQTIVTYGGRRRSGEIHLKIGSEWPEQTIDAHIFQWPSAPGWCIAMTLESHAILVDRQLNPVLSLGTPGEQLAPSILELIGLPGEPQVILEQAFVAHQRVAGWSAVGKMFKPDDLALAAGSTFLLRFPDGNKEDIREWSLMLAANGLGLRRAEGFGQITFADPLHKKAASDAERWNAQ